LGILFDASARLNSCCSASKSAPHNSIHGFSPETDQRLHDKQPVSCSPRLSMPMSSCWQWLHSLHREAFFGRLSTTFCDLSHCAECGGQVGQAGWATSGI